MQAEPSVDAELEAADEEDSFDALLREASHVPALAIPMPERGTLLRGRFEVLRRLGEGGMGVVYKVHDRGGGGDLALKTLSHLDAVNIQRLKREFRSLSGVVHPNLVGFHELFSDGLQWFFTMDLVEGRDFLTFAQAGNNTAMGAGAGDRKRLASLRDALRQLVSGVQAIHAAGKLHRDLKPSNVLVTAAGRVVILDFGLVADQVGDEGEQRASGTPAYMAPEQAAQRPATPASDFYAVGVMLYQALTGRLPFEGTRGEVLARRRSGPAPSGLSPSLPQDLALLCEALLSPDPSRRPDADAILRRLGGQPRDTTRASTPPLLPDGSRARSDLGQGGDAFIGRAQQLSQLQAAFQQVTPGAPRVALVHGSSGIGKTALVARFAAELSRTGRALVLSARCYEREAVPFKAFDGIVDELVAHLRSRPASEVDALLPRDVHALARVFPVLTRVSQVARAVTREVAIDDPLELRARAFTALKNLLHNLSLRAPLLLVIDDLQWSDTDSARLLEAVVSSPHAPTMLVIGIYRREDAQTSHFLQRVLSPATPEELYRRRVAAMFKLDARWLPQTDSQDASAGLDPSRLLGAAQLDPDAERVALGAVVPIDDIAVDRLTPADGRRLARAWLADAFPAPDELAERLVHEADGSPFYIQELAQHLRSLAETGLLPSAQPPQRMVSLHDALSARVAALPDDARHLLEVIAVAGRPIRRDLCLRAAELPLDDRRGFDLLRALHLIRTRGPGFTDDVEVYHDRVRDLLSRNLDPQRRRARHAALAHVLEQSGEAQADWLAEQFYGAGQGEQAANYAVAAASQSRGALAFAAAADLYRWASSVVSSQYEAAVRRGTLRGTVLGTLLGLFLSVVFLLVEPDATTGSHLSTFAILMIGMLAGTFMGMIVGSVVTLVTTQAPSARIDAGPEPARADRRNKQRGPR